MIILGLTLQNKEKKVPKELADWLEGRREKYTLVEFQIERDEDITVQKAYRTLAEKYQKLYYISNSGPVIGCSNVVFPYGKESWYIRIMGLVNSQGEMVDVSLAVKGDRALPPEIRNAIADIPTDKDKISEEEGFIGEKRGLSNPLKEVPEEMVEIKHEFQMESELTMSGAQFADIMGDPKTYKEAVEAIVHKDYKSLEDIGKRKLN